MSSLRTTWTHVFYTPIPPTTTPDTVTTLLHDHKALIHLSPLVTDSKLHPDESPDTASSNDPASTKSKHYTVWERITILSFAWLGLGAWTQQISFEVEFLDTRDGLETLIAAPLGMVSKATYAVMRVEDARRGVEMKLGEDGNGTLRLGEEDIANGDDGHVHGGGGGGGHGEGRREEVVVDAEGEEVTTEFVLREVITSQVNFLFKRTVDGDMVPTRRAMAKRIMDRAAEGRGDAR